jgi:ribosomal protein S18 acetylase RimI-like enzyme
MRRTRSIRVGAMSDLALESAAALSVSERARLFTAAYEDYVVPFALDEERLLFMEGAFGTDVERSLLLRVEGEPAGLANLAHDGEDGWVAGIGIVKPLRGAGRGEALMRALIERARAAGVTRLWLEVIVENVAARRLYEKLGFEHVRLLEVWRLEGAAGEARTVPVEEAQAFVRARRTWREPWQRTDATVERMRALEPQPQGVLVEGGAAVVRATPELASIVQLAADSEEAYERLLAGVQGLARGVLLLNLPEGDPAAAALASLGGSPAIRQHEMLLAL